MYPRAFVTVFAAALLVVSILAIPSAAQQSSAQVADGTPHLDWHRLNPGSSPEHERLRCHRVVNGELSVDAASADSAWVCRYDKVPEPDLNLTWNATFGTFGGVDVTGATTCPAWTGVCGNVVRIIDGVFRYTPATGSPFTQREQLLLKDDGNMTLVWVGFGFACPWFQTFQIALDANPSRAPGDCVSR